MKAKTGHYKNKFEKLGSTLSVHGSIPLWLQIFVKGFKIMKAIPDSTPPVSHECKVRYLFHVNIQFLLSFRLAVYIDEEFTSLTEASTQ